jgi:hypothetical protein
VTRQILIIAITVPRAPKFALRRSELDPSWLVIRLMAAARLVAVVGTRLEAPPTRRAEA